MNYRCQQKQKANEERNQIDDWKLVNKTPLKKKKLYKTPISLYNRFSLLECEDFEKHESRF